MIIGAKGNSSFKVLKSIINIKELMYKNVYKIALNRGYHVILFMRITISDVNQWGSNKMHSKYWLTTYQYK